MQLTAAGRAVRNFSVPMIAGFVLAACGGSSEPPPPVATIELTPSDATVDVGQTTQLSAVLKDADGNTLSGRALSWTSSTPSVASVNQTGVVTGVADGEATITATSENRTGTASILVLGPCSTEHATRITVGQTINGSLANTDCRLTNEGIYGDGYGITVTAATSVQIDMTATFDTYLELLELLPNGDFVGHAVNDDIDPYDPANPNDPFDTNSRITFTLQPNLDYYIVASSYDPNVFANYQLKVTAAAVVAGRTSGAKPGKPPIAPRLKALKPPK